ncbi:hypothetical protein RF11_04744 [Thelohanellus kitauei]|uniref:Uncharacterized protein n=1 Tax=Thelohanellus kitauei TaxID=669202 RepID=A0A0C2IZZ7_THEKT|nr:hypothetical protein RF11_04744 [Thelohanellus kitauei]
MSASAFTCLDGLAINQKTPNKFQKRRKVRSPYQEAPDELEGHPPCVKRPSGNAVDDEIKAEFSARGLCLTRAKYNKYKRSGLSKLPSSDANYAQLCSFLRDLKKSRNSLSNSFVKFESEILASGRSVQVFAS